MKKILLVLMLVILSTSVFAVPAHQDKYVNDYANVFNSTQVAELRTLFSNIDSETTAEMTLLTVDTVASLDMFLYAQEVAESWKIGKADKDNGLLILYAKQENKIWVSVGYGLEGILPDSKIGRILDQTFVPARAANNTAEGIILAAKEYANVISTNADDVRSGNASSRTDDLDISFTILLLLILFGFPIVGAIYDRIFTPKCKECKRRTKLIRAETVVEKEKGGLGGMHNVEYAVKTYKCPNCGCLVVKKTKKRNRTLLPLILLAGSRRGFGSSGGGFGGGFGGGGFGGGGAGR